MLQLPHTHSCFVCGDQNPVGLQLKFETDGDQVLARFVPRPEHAGFTDVIHGGLLATLLDEIMVWGVAVKARRFAYAAELTVRFVQPARPGDPVIARAELVANRRNRLFEAKAELRTEAGDLLASGTGKYLPVPRDQLGKLRTDLTGNLSPIMDVIQPVD